MSNACKVGTGIGERPLRGSSYAVAVKGSVAGVEAAGEVAAVLGLVLERVSENEEKGLEDFDEGVCLVVAGVTCWTGVTGCGRRASCPSWSCSWMEIGYGRVVKLDLFDLVDSRRDALRDRGRSLSDATEKRLKTDDDCVGTGGGIKVGTGGAWDSVGVNGIHARSWRYSDTAVCLFRLIYGLNVDCLVPPGDSGSSSSSHSSLAARRTASSSDCSAVGVSGVGADVDRYAGTGREAYGLV